MENEITLYFKQKGWQYKFQSGEYILKNCPICLDSKYHFYISKTTGQFKCHKCNEQGNLFSLKKKLGDIPERKPLQPTKTINLEKIERQHKELLNNNSALDYLISRGFSIDTIKEFHLGCEGDWISIPFLLGGEPILIKYRRYRGQGDKYKREPGFDSNLFICPTSINNKEVIITEGEFDAISLAQLGFSNVVGVSTGAGGFKPEWIDFFESYQKIFICFDNDKTGEDGAEKLAERLGKYRCYRVKLPLKDANECLFAEYTKKELDEYFNQAQEYKPKNLKTPNDYLENLERLWKRDRTETVTTGWDKLDRFLGGLRRGELTILSGETGQGKSTWACNLAYNRMIQGDLVWIGSFESKPPPLLAKLISIHSQKSFYKLSEAEFSEALPFIVNLPLRFLDHWGAITIQNLKDSVFYCKRRFDTRLVIIDHLHAFLKYSGDAERQAIDQAITEIKSWAMDLEIPIFLIVHPKNIQGQRGNPIIEATDLKGSSGIRQWADNVISIWRNKKKEESEGISEVALKILKARDDTAREGTCVLRFDPESQRYFDDV